MPCTGALGSGSSVFWSRPSSSPPRRTPSLRQEQQTEGERETGGVKRRKGWEMQGGRGQVGGGSGSGAKGQSRGEGREGGRGRAGGRESWGTVGGGRGRGGGAEPAPGTQRQAPGRPLQVSLKRCVTDTLPSVSRCLLWAGVRRSEPLSQQEGPTRTAVFSTMSTCTHVPGTPAKASPLRASL